MNKKQIQASARFALDRGISRPEVFAHLRKRGMKDSQLALYLASYVDPARRLQHAGKVKLLVALMVVQAVIGFMIGFGEGARIGPNARWVFAIGVAVVSLLFAWGFYRYRVAAYNAYLLLSIIQLPKSFDGFMDEPFAASVGLVINVALLAYVACVRYCLFPDFTFMTPRKIKGQYVFSS